MTLGKKPEDYKWIIS